MNKPRLLLDCDQVLADFVGAYLDTVADFTGITYKREALPSWKIQDHLPLTKEQKRLVSDAVRSEGWCARIKPCAGAVEGFAEIRDICDVRIVTSPWPGNYWAGERIEWLHHYFDIPLKHVYQLSEKESVWGDLIVDDKAETVVDWQKKWHRSAYLWETPHNLQDTHVVRLRSWSELAFILREMQ